jgi:hypothetical protein
MCATLHATEGGDSRAWSRISDGPATTEPEQCDIHDAHIAGVRLEADVAAGTPLAAGLGPEIHECLMIAGRGNEEPVDAGDLALAALMKGSTPGDAMRR